MASFSAELQVSGTVFPVRHCSFEVHQATHQRGRVNTKVRYGLVQLTLDVPDGDLLLTWTATSQKRLAVAIVFRDANGGNLIETLSLKAAYCVQYSESFQQGDTTTGAYVCELTLSDPDGFTLQAGGPAATFLPPAAREHGSPIGGVALAATNVMTAPASRQLVAVSDIPPHLSAPQPNPSPDHQQVHLSANEWQQLTRGRWDSSKSGKRGRFLKPEANCEFHVTGDPFTYRTDGEGKMVAVYDAQRSYNVTGSKKGLMGIPLTLNGEPTYAGTPHMFPVTGDQKNVVAIPLQGNRKSDFREANEAAGLTALVAAQGKAPHEAPDGYVWHHRDDFVPNNNSTPPPYGTGTMELVEVEAHKKTFVHYGSCDQVNQHVGRKIYQ